MRRTLAGWWHDAWGVILVRVLWALFVVWVLSHFELPPLE